MPVGLLWSALAPRVQVVATADGGLDFVDSETKAFIGADATLFLLGLATGLLAAVVVWRFGRRARLAALVGLVLGAAAAAWLAGRIGVLGGDRAALLASARAGQLHGPADLPLQLRAHAVLLSAPAAAAATYACLVFRRPAPRPEIADGGPDGNTEDPPAAPLLGRASSDSSEPGSP